MSIYQEIIVKQSLTGSHQLISYQAVSTSVYYIHIHDSQPESALEGIKRSGVQKTPLQHLQSRMAPVTAETDHKTRLKWTEKL